MHAQKKTSVYMEISYMTKVASHITAEIINVLIKDEVTTEKLFGKTD